MRKPPYVFAVYCTLVILILLAPAALAAPGSAQPPDKAAADAAIGLSGPSAITAADALPLPGPDFYDTLVAEEYEDLWTISAVAGQAIVISMSTAASEDFDLALWAPGTTDFSYHSNAVAVSWHYGGTEDIRYIVPAGADGTYYIDVWDMYPPPSADPSYHLTAAVQEAFLPIPGVDFTDALDVPGYEDFWTVDANAGQQLIVTLNPPSGVDLDLALWAPGTTDFTYHYSDSLRYSAHLSGFEDFKYVVPAGAGGTYIITVWSDDEVGGTYRLRVNKQSPSRTAVRIAPPAVPLRCVTGRSYTSYGTLKPLHYRKDTSVKAIFQKYSGGRWRDAGTRAAANANYSTYTRYKITYSFYGWGSGSMRWRVRAVHVADALHPRKLSDWRYFTVRL